MRKSSIKVLSKALSLAIVGLFLAMGTAQAQGKGRDRDRDHHDRDRDRDHVHYRVAPGEVEQSRVPPGLAKKGGVPPGLAKKGGLPPGQARKRYRADDGVTALRDVFSRHGYTVVRTANSGDTRYVYYRLRNGTVHRAIVMPGSDRLRFRNVPDALVREVYARLY